MSLTGDTQFAWSKGLKFEVTRKAARGARWLTVETDIEDLEQAIEKAKAVEDYESGVFVAFPPERAGFLYWSSRYPDRFNDTVLTMEIYYDEDESET
jgi:hypothetical protein